MITFKNYLTEEFKTENDKTIITTGFLKHTRLPSDYDEDKYYDSIHDHPDVEPKNLSQKQIDAIKIHTEESRDYNNYLDKKHKDITYAPHSENSYVDHIKTLSSAFNPENTNKKPIISYSSIPERIGNVFLNSPKNSKHTIARFTSTSTNKNIALNFGVTRQRPHDDAIHLLKLHNQPGAALSVPKYSHLSTEDELLLNHGAHVTYHYSKSEKHPEYGKIITHFVTVHPTHTPLEEYGKT